MRSQQDERARSGLICGVLLVSGSLVLVAAGCGGGAEGSSIHANLDNALRLRTELESGVGGASAVVQLADPTGFASIRGQVKFIGAAPSPSPLQVRDFVCMPGSPRPMDETLEVDSATGGIANVAVYLDTKIPLGDPKWEHETYLAQRDAELLGASGFDQKDCVFTTHVFAMRSTQKVEILNSDSIGHNTNIAPPKGADRMNQTIGGGRSLLYAPNGEAPAPFPVNCSIHPWMKAYMIVRDSPYFTVTDTAGQFEIKNVPAGVELEFRIWQEAASFPKQVTINGQVQKLSKGKFKITLEPDVDQQLEIGIDQSAF